MRHGKLHLDALRAEAGRQVPPDQTTDQTLDHPGVVLALKPWREHRAQVLELAERAYFSALLLHTGGEVAPAARVSGLKSARLYELLAKHGLLKARRGQMPIPEFPENCADSGG